MLAKTVRKVRAAVEWAESPSVAQKWRALRLGAAVIASSGVIDSLANGTVTRTALVAAVVAAVEVTYRAWVK